MSDLMGGSDTIVSTVEPEPKEGSKWINPRSGIYAVAYGGEWHPVPPVQVTEETITFNENDVTVSYESTRPDSGSIELGGYPIDLSDGGDYTDYTELGSVVNPNTDLEGIEVTSWSDTKEWGGTDGHIMVERVSDGTILADKSIGESPIGSKTFTVKQPLSAGTDYAVYLRNDNGDWGDSSYTSDSTVSGRDIDITTGWRNGSATGEPATWTEITPITNPTSGSATITWPSPSRIKSWDLATFQRSVDGETVTIDILDGSSNVLYSDVSPNFDISTVSISENVQIRVNLERADISNNPTLDYAARRYVQ